MTRVERMRAAGQGPLLRSLQVLFDEGLITLEDVQRLYGDVYGVAVVAVRDRSRGPSRRRVARWCALAFLLSFALSYAIFALAAR